MIIITQLSADVLKLLAYSYQEKEFTIVRNFFRQHKLENREESITRDNHDRKGIQFTLRSLLTIKAFEKKLGITISDKVGYTRVEFLKSSSEPGEEPYCCIRLSPKVFEKGCVDIVAPDNTAAFVKCALIAGELHWFGAESEQGKCHLHNDKF